ncbi:MAG: ATP-binding protein [Clostridia bacterium]|nr:ATP-binding protein [Clostridia bacterium]
MNSFSQIAASSEDCIYDKIQLILPNKPEYVSVARLTASAIANRVGFNIEDIEDIKVAIAEACTNAILHGCTECENSFVIDFKVEPGNIEITVKDKGKGMQVDKLKKPDLSNPKEGGLGVFIIKSLMDEVELKSNEGRGTVLTMRKSVTEEE